MRINLGMIMVGEVTTFRDGETEVDTQYVGNCRSLCLMFGRTAVETEEGGLTRTSSIVDYNLNHRFQYGDDACMLR